MTESAASSGSRAWFIMETSTAFGRMLAEEVLER
jgi:hypothetical protein